MNDNSGIVSIAVEELHQHPDNPRKDLGDLSELSESVRKKGVMQNLTVLRGHMLPDGKTWNEGGYTILIGHRRCAAAKLAGLAELPCRIVENLSPKEQMAIMLEENMQRNDLTIWEQAQGFQMMLDLGETEESIAEKTGFSKTTVRHRLNIAKLDQKVLQEKGKNEGFQLTLKDLYELEKIPDVKTRNKILKEANNSNNLVCRAREAAISIKRREHEKAYIKLCRKEGIKPAPKGTENMVRYSDKWEIVKEFDLDEEVKAKTGCQTKAKKEELFYVTYWIKHFAIIRKAEKKEKKLSEAEIRQMEKAKRKKKIKAMAKAMSEERMNFVRLAIEQKFKPGKGKPEAVMERLFGLLVEGNAYLLERTMIEFITGEISLYNKTDEEKAEYEKQRDAIGLLYRMMIYAVRDAADKDLAEYSAAYNTKNGKIILELDEILTLFGFSYSKEEYYKLAEGSHDLYKEGEIT